MTNKTYTKDAYQAKQTEEALKSMKLLEQKIRNGKLKVVRHGFWASGIGGKCNFVLEVSDDDIRNS